MKIAALQYAYIFPKSFEEYEKCTQEIVSDLAAKEVDFIVFPEYAGYDMATIPNWDGLEDKYTAIFQKLSKDYNVHICSGTHFIKEQGKTYNRSFLFAPNGTYDYQDKCTLTPYEVEEGVLSPGYKQTLFHTAFGKVGICVCYDSEFPHLVENLVAKGANLILVPSYTSSRHGFYRVFVACRARALEHQCYVVQSAIVGQTDVEIAYGAAAISCPIDQPFPEDGVLKRGEDDQVGHIIADLDFALLDTVRQNGQTKNYLDAIKWKERSLEFKEANLK